MFDGLFFLVNKKTALFVDNFIKKNKINIPFQANSSVSKDFFDKKGNVFLFSFGVGEIVSSDVLKKCSLAINIHAASPQYPGRDPHHFACYDGAKEYGATAHLMEERVDSGKIIDIELVKVKENANSKKFLKIGNECGTILMERILDKILLRKEIPVPISLTWGKTKTKRSDFLEACFISSDISSTEMERKYRSFQEDAYYPNLYTLIHGHRFVIEEQKDNLKYQDFTEETYQKLLDKLLEGYQFIGFSDPIDEKKPQVIWRHDIDVSVYRALRLAEIEYFKGIRSTFFVLLYSWFYNIHDPEIIENIIKIRELGHEIGLHYDYNYHSHLNKKNEFFIDSLRKQKKELEDILGFSIQSFSMHNPTLMPKDMVLNQNELMDAYRFPGIEKFKYCSDSNGLWKFDRLENLIDPEKHPKLYVLTHAEWWTPNPMSPRNRILRALNGYQSRMMNRYDALLDLSNAPNE